MNPSLSKTFVIAAGGTGGHVFPAEAVTEELVRLGHRVVLITDKRFSSYGGTLGQIEKHCIRAGTLGRGMLSKATAAVDICVGLFQARQYLKKIQPDAVIGFGGYPSFPTMRAAIMLGIPTLIHEQNSVMGRANKYLASKVQAIATSFLDTKMPEDIDRSKLLLVGNPVRGAIRALRDVPYSELTDQGAIRILVIGGSQGASTFSEVIPAAVALLPASLRARLRIDQQCRMNDMDSVRSAYANSNIQADLAPFFTDIPARLASTHLVISRAGASSVCELAVAGRPSILVPLPTAMDNHQYFNALALESAAGAWLIPQDGFTASALAARLEALLTLPSKLTQAAGNAMRVGRIHAARDTAALSMHIASGGSIADFLSEPTAISSVSAKSVIMEKAA
jgi:UDP-N-acetylglucosamine--N-acetylmuramyl-(pentapeptide) pyrophosphoryl-undecaprenol N-acetylglucosamine transferase